MIKKIFISICFLFSTLLLADMQAQNSHATENQCPIKAVPDFFKRKDTSLVRKPKKENFLLIVPIIGSQPATGFSYGFVTQYTFKGKLPDDKYSFFNFSATYTAKKQLLINARHSIMRNNNKIFLSGDWRYLIFSQPNYGLGTDIIPPMNSDEDFDLTILEEPMAYNYFKFHQTASWAVQENLYVGAGIHLDWYTKIVDKNLDVIQNQYTNHYKYSTKYGFTGAEYNINGISINLLYDSRDNQINTNNGMFLNINYRINPAFTEKQQASNVLFMEYRYFLPLSKLNKQHVFGVLATSQMVTAGNVPYLNLPSIGWDQRNRAGKGYIQGLFRGQKMVYLDTEYRFPISCNQLLSGVAFANFTSTSDQDRQIRLFQYVQPAVGVGVRILIDKVTRTNLVANYAIGNRSQAFYLNAGESF